MQYTPMSAEQVKQTGPSDGAFIFNSAPLFGCSAPPTMTGTTKVLADSPPAGLIPELQLHRCMSSRYKSEQFPRCVSCTRRWAGDTCRFQGIRFFLKDQKGTIVGVSFVENQKPDAPNMNFPNMWNTRLEESHIRETKVCLC